MDLRSHYLQQNAEANADFLEATFRKTLLALQEKVKCLSGLDESALAKKSEILKIITESLQELGPEPNSKESKLPLGFSSFKI